MIAQSLHDALVGAWNDPQVKDNPQQIRDNVVPLFNRFKFIVENKLQKGTPLQKTYQADIQQMSKIWFPQQQQQQQQQQRRQQQDIDEDEQKQT